MKTNFKKPAQIHFHSKTLQTIRNMDSTMAGSENDNISMDSTTAGSANVRSLLTTGAN